jgi:hypothetical protein
MFNRLWKRIDVDIGGCGQNAGHRCIQKWMTGNWGALATRHHMTQTDNVTKEHISLFWPGNLFFTAAAERELAREDIDEAVRYAAFEKSSGNSTVVPFLTLIKDIFLAEKGSQMVN